MKKGFTLLEIMLALAVFAVAVAGLVGFNARGYVNDAKARQISIATDLARGKMVDYQLEIEKEINKGSFPEEKAEDGGFDRPYDNYRWKAEIRKVELPLPPLGENMGEATGQLMQMMTKQISDAVREIKITISWSEMEKERSFSIVTHIVKL